MAVVPLYKQTEPKARMLDALRRGMTRAEAAEAGGSKAGTFAGWVERDALWQQEVELAEQEARETGAVRTAKVARDEKTGGDRWAKFREEAARLGAGTWGVLLYLDGILAAKPGAHAMSQWWRWSLGEWYASGKAVYLGRIGRGGGKSTTQTEVVVTETLFGERDVPPGETWIWPFLSVDMSEANLKVGPLEHALGAVGLDGSTLTKHSGGKAGRTVLAYQDAKGQQVEVRVYPATVDAMSGPTLAGATNDEEAKWKADRDKGVNSAEEVLDAMGQCFRGDATTKKHMRISSAWMTRGPHFDDIEAGDNELHYVARIGPFLDVAVAGFELVATRLVAAGKHDDARMVRQYAATLTEDSPNVPSWVANPTHDVWGGFLRARQRTRKWLRECGSWSSDEADEGDYFDHQTIDAGCVVARVITREVDGRFPAIDTGASRNPSALGIVERVVHEVCTNGRRERRYQFRPYLLRERRRTGRPLDLRNDVLPEFARAIIEAQCIPTWWSDGWSAHDILNVGALFGITTHFISTSTVTRDMYEPLDSALREDPCPVVLSGCENVEAAVAQLRAVMRAADGKAIVREVGVDHGEFGQVFVRALAHAGIGTLPPDAGDDGFESDGSDRGDGCSTWDRYE
jgi:hypothetical protein